MNNYLCNVRKGAKILAVFLAGVYVMVMLGNSGVLLNFYMNRDYIAEFLCIERDQPESTCNGSCHLEEQLEETNEPAESHSPREQLRFEANLYCQSLFNGLPEGRTLYSYKSFTPQVIGEELSGFPAGILDPPQA